MLELRGSVPGDSIARSTGSKMLIYFHSDESVTDSGFEAFYVASSTGNVDFITLTLYLTRDA